MQIYDEITAERQAQDKKWGGPSHDDGHSAMDWVFYIGEHSVRASQNFLNFRKQMIRVAALAIAAIEWYDRNHKGA